MQLSINQKYYGNVEVLDDEDYLNNEGDNQIINQNETEHSIDDNNAPSYDFEVHQIEDNGMEIKHF